MPSPRLLDHDEPVRVRVRGEHDEEPPEPDQLRRVRRERRVAAAHAEARDEHGPMRSVSCPLPHLLPIPAGGVACDLGAPRRVGSFVFAADAAAAVSRTLSAPRTPSTRSFKDTEPARARIEPRAHGGAGHVQRADVPPVVGRRLERVETAVPSCLGEPPDACVRRASRRRRAARRAPGPRRGTPRRGCRGPTRRSDRTSRRPRRRAARARRSPPRRSDPRRAARLEAPRC